MGIPQPEAAGVPELMARYSKAGTSIPPKAANRGRVNLSREFNSPAMSSRFISGTNQQKEQGHYSIVHRQNYRFVQADRHEICKLKLELRKSK